MRLKVIQSQMSSSWMVVREEYGEIREAPNGVKFSYEPLPLCRVPQGYGRINEEAKGLAETIARLLDESMDEERAAGAPPITSEELDLVSGDEIPF